MASRPSRTAKDVPGHSVVRRTAAPIPERPAPTMTVSNSMGSNCYRGRDIAPPHVRGGSEKYGIPPLDDGGVCDAGLQAPSGGVPHVTMLKWSHEEDRRGPVQGHVPATHGPCRRNGRTDRGHEARQGARPAHPGIDAAGTGTVHLRRREEHDSLPRTRRRALHDRRYVE